MKNVLKRILVKTRLIVLWDIYKKFKQKGFGATLRYFLFKLSFVRGFHKINEIFVEKKINSLLSSNSGMPIILSLSFIDWNVPLYQRPQHIAIQLAKQGFLYFYHTRNHYDYINGYKNIGKNMYLTNRFDELLEKLGGKEVYLHVYSTNMYEDDDERIELAMEKGFKVIYEYIDEISEKISGTKIPEFVIKRHERLLKDEENVFVIATATKLYNDVKEHRNKNFKLVTNGVVCEHFRNIQKRIPKEIENIVKEGKPIVGYYGALASWFDYKLIKEIADMRRDWNILLIGWDYDGSLSKSKIRDIKNIHIVGPIEYTKLPSYAQWFDVSIIPFVINEVTESTSPVKLFEYMALGKSIVTTPMPECKKYNSVIISNNEPRDFVDKIESALKKKEDANYLELLEKEALENTWEKKAQDIKVLINSLN